MLETELIFFVQNLSFFRLVSLPISTTWLPCLSQLDCLLTGGLLGGILGLNFSQFLHAVLATFSLWSWATLSTGILAGVDSSNAVLIALFLSLGGVLGALGLLDEECFLSCLGAHAVLVVQTLLLV